MNLPIRSILALSILVIVLAACGATVAAPASEPPVPTQPVATPTPKPSVAPTEAPSEAPAEPAEPAEPTEPTAEPRKVAGTITLFEGTFSGPGGTIQEALDHGPSEWPTLVNGVLFRDTDGKIYIATSVSDVTAPTFDGPMLEVLEYPNDGPSWDMANAELLGLKEANGIVFLTGAQVLGHLELR